MTIDGAAVAQVVVMLLLSLATIFNAYQSAATRAAVAELRAELIKRISDQRAESHKEFARRDDVARFETKLDRLVEAL